MALRRLRKGSGIKMKKQTYYKKAILLLALMCLATGCGGEEAEPAMQDMVQAEEVQPEEGTLPKEEIQPEEETQPEEEIQSEKETQPKETVPEEIDDTTRRELTTQLLEEQELDTSVLEPTKTTDGLEFALPEGFEEADDMPGVYVTGRYPIDVSSIYYAEREQDISLQLMTEELFLAHVKETFASDYGKDVDITLESFEKIKIDGYPAFRILCSYTLEEIKITQLEYIINADKSYILTYSQTSDYDRMAEFEESAATIRVTGKE